MENFNINNLDIKTLRLLLDIARTKSVSQAAQLRCITQSTASYSLSKLRQAFDDALFLRTGHEMIITDRGQEIVNQCHNLIDALDSLNQNSFDPNLMSRDFVIASTDYELQRILVPLRNSFNAFSGNLKLIVKEMDLTNQVELLKNEWDLAIMASPSQDQLIQNELLFYEDFVTFYDPTKRTAPQTVEDFYQSHHIVVTLGGDVISTVDRQLGSRKRCIALVVPNFASLASMMCGTDLITTLPKGLSKYLLKEFSWCKCPIPLERLAIQSVWHKRRETQPAHRWLRQQIHTIASGAE